MAAGMEIELLISCLIVNINASCYLVAHLCLILCDPIAYSPPGWSGLLFPSPWDLPDPGMKPTSPALSLYHWATREAQMQVSIHENSKETSLRHSFRASSRESSPVDTLVSCRCPILDFLLFTELNRDYNFCKYFLNDQTSGEKLSHQYVYFW